MSYSSFGTTLSILGFVVCMFTTDWNQFSLKEYWPHYLCSICLLLLSIWFICIRFIKHKRMNKGSKVIRSLQQRASKLEAQLPNKNYEDCQSKTIQMCSKISEAFSIIKNTQISVCIKFINTKDKLDYVETLARDYKSLDERDDNDETNDALNDNSDFKSIISSHSNINTQKRWSDIFYCQNNLPHIYGYYNSHLDETKLSNGIFGIFARHFQWPLPYRSTLIVPISNYNDDSFYGFLCLDSKQIYSFNCESDIEMLSSVVISIWKITELTLSKIPKH